MTECDYQHEQDLRSQTRMKGAKDAAQILADFYEQLGQPSRAMLWRRTVRVHAQRRPADLIVQDPKWQRKVMMWLLGHVTSQAAVASAFRSSKRCTKTLIREIESKICAAANVERHYPTMAATLRLQATRALPRPFEQGAFELGEVPPESWPITSKQRPPKPQNQET